MPIRKRRIIFCVEQGKSVGNGTEAKKTMEDRATQPLDDMRLRFATYLL